MWYMNECDSTTPSKWHNHFDVKNKRNTLNKKKTNMKLLRREHCSVYIDFRNSEATSMTTPLYGRMWSMKSKVHIASCRNYMSAKSHVMARTMFTYHLLCTRWWKHQTHSKTDDKICSQRELDINLPGKTYII